MQKWYGSSNSGDLLRSAVIAANETSGRPRDQFRTLQQCGDSRAGSFLRKSSSGKQSTKPAYIQRILLADGTDGTELEGLWLNLWDRAAPLNCTTTPSFSHSR
ncbi:hypothetical protein Q5P01_003182 [Channa striata]|uniref:Uncharacterized protein n=1 Tax=Channa striata TaxID=64152 RepID=A0AA88NHE1_CHASR|nr:hypothetical protein Q5P01_003182 [Channa striata]